MNDISKENIGIIPNDVVNVISEIEKFETDYNIVFPLEYKTFLKKYNGGKTNKIKFTKEGWQSKFYGDSICIEEFYSIQKIYDAYQDKIYEQKCDFEEIKPIRKMVPIARASGNYSILMSLEKKQKGELYLQDDRNRQSFTTILITNSFGDLLMSSKKERTIVGNLLQKKLVEKAKTEEEKQRLNNLFENQKEKLKEETYTNLEI